MFAPASLGSKTPEWIACNAIPKWLIVKWEKKDNCNILCFLGSCTDFMSIYSQHHKNLRYLLRFNSIFFFFFTKATFSHNFLYINHTDLNGLPAEQQSLKKKERGIVSSGVKNVPQ